MGWLVVLSIVAISLAPLTAAGLSPLVGRGLGTLIVLAAVAGLATELRWFWLLAPLGVLRLIDLWSETQVSTAMQANALRIAGGLLLIAVVVRVKGVVFDRKLPVGVRLIAAIAGYLMMIELFATLHYMVLMAAPGAIVAASGQSVMPTDLVYFSVITQTTVGYGDLSPVHPVSRGLCMLQALLGVLFLAVAIAGLVGRVGAEDGKLS